MLPLNGITAKPLPDYLESLTMKLYPYSIIFETNMFTNEHYNKVTNTQLTNNNIALAVTGVR